MPTLLPRELRDCADYLSLLNRVLDELVALGIERNGGYRGPVPGVTRPAAWIARSGLHVEFVPDLQDRTVFLRNSN